MLASAQKGTVQSVPFSVHAALVDDVAIDGNGGNVAPGDDAAGGVADAVGCDQLDALVRLHQAAAQIGSDEKSAMQKCSSDPDFPV